MSSSSSSSSSFVIATIPKEEEEEEIATKTAGRTTLEGRVDDVTEPLMS